MTATSHRAAARYAGAGIRSPIVWAGLAAQTRQDNSWSYGQPCQLAHATPLCGWCRPGAGGSTTAFAQKLTIIAIIDAACVALRTASSRPDAVERTAIHSSRGSGWSSLASSQRVDTRTWTCAKAVREISEVDVVAKAHPGS